VTHDGGKRVKSPAEAGRETGNDRGLSISFMRQVLFVALSGSSGLTLQRSATGLKPDARLGIATTAGYGTEPTWQLRGFLASCDDRLALFRWIPDIAGSLVAASKR